MDETTAPVALDDLDGDPLDPDYLDAVTHTRGSGNGDPLDDANYA